MQVELAILLRVKIDTPLYQLPDLGRGILDDLLDSGRVADEITGNHGVVDVFLEVVHFQIRDTCHAALRKGGVSLVKTCLADDTYLSLFGTGNLQGIAHPGYTSSDDQKIIFVYHDVCI